MKSHLSISNLRNSYQCDTHAQRIFLAMLGRPQTRVKRGQHDIEVAILSSITLHPAPPFRLDLTAWALRRVPANQVDRWDGHEYRRVLTVDGSPMEVCVRQEGSPESPLLEVRLEKNGAAIETAAASVSRMLGLNIDLSDFYRLAGGDPRLHELARRFEGMKPPRLGSAFEALLNGIACQQISLNVGIILLNRLAAAVGLESGGHYAFPRPEDLVGHSVEELRAFGFSRRKAANMLTTAGALVDGELDLDSLEQTDDAEAVSALCGIQGVGRWTAEYVALRGLGKLDVFPADDVGAQNKLRNWLGLSTRPGYHEVHKEIDRWSPFRGLIYFHLLLDGLAQQGLVEPSI